MKSTTKKIMIVDDSIDLLLLYKTQVSMLGAYEVDYVSSARDAIRTYHEAGAKYDLVITDLSMPDKSGEGLIYDLFYLNPKQPIAVLSADLSGLNVPGEANVAVYKKPTSIVQVIQHSLR